MLNITYCKRVLITLFIYAFIFSAVEVVKAQSGRRVQKQPATPVATPTPEPIVESKPQPKIDIPKTTLSVMSDIGQNMYMEFTYPERMQAWVVDRLRKSPVLDVMTDSPARRDEAIKRAKQQTDTFSIWLQLDMNVFSDPGSAQRRSQKGEVWINYYVYSPQTGKAKYTGQIPLNSGRYTGGIGGTRAGISCYPSIYGDDLLLLLASIEVADRIMSNFSVPIPPVCSSRI